jgi:hypothetical protein
VSSCLRVPGIFRMELGRVPRVHPRPLVDPGEVLPHSHTPCRATTLRRRGRAPDISPFDGRRRPLLGERLRAGSSVWRRSGSVQPCPRGTPFRVAMTLRSSACSSARPGDMRQVRMVDQDLLARCTRRLAERGRKGVRAIVRALSRLGMRVAALRPFASAHWRRVGVGRLLAIRLTSRDEGSALHAAGRDPSARLFNVPG